MSDIGNLRSAVVRTRTSSGWIMRSERIARVVALGALTALIVSCGGGRSPPPPTSVSGTITGLTGTGMTLQLNHANNLAVAPGTATFSFPPMPPGTNFTVSVSQQPLTPPQTCTVLNPAGTISSTMSAISVECTNPSEEVIVSAGANSTAFFVEPTTGRLYPSGVYFTLPASFPVATDPAGKFLFAVDDSGQTVSGYTVSGSTGALVAITGSPFAVGNHAFGLVVDPTGRFLYVGSQGAYAYKIDQESGALSLITGSPFASSSIGLNPGAVVCQGVCVASDSILYFPQFTGAGSFDILGFSIDGTTGALALNNSVDLSTCCTSETQAVIDPSHKFFYVANGDLIITYAINAATGALTYAATTADGGTYITLDPSGAFAYAIAGGDVWMYSRDPNTGLLTPLSPSSVAGSGEQITFDLLGEFVYVRDGYNISGYTFNSTTGVLTPISGGPFTSPHLPTGMAIMRIP